MASPVQRGRSCFYHMGGSYGYVVKSNRDIRDTLGLTMINFDADTGALISLETADGRA